MASGPEETLAPTSAERESYDMHNMCYRGARPRRRPGSPTSVDLVQPELAELSVSSAP